MSEADLLFKALADPVRRRLLDRLHAHDGQTLTQQCRHLDMTRQGVTQHLAVLETANLVAVVRRGRERLHFLNPVPLQELYDRWIRKFERPRLRALRDLKHRLEEDDRAEPRAGRTGMSAENRSSFVYVTYIRTTPAKLWAALTEQKFIGQYWFGVTIDCDWKKGSPWKMVFPDGTLVDSGEILEVDPPRRMVIKWQHEWKPEIKAEGPGRCTFELEPVGNAVKLTITHEIDRPEAKLITAVSDGWPKILSNLKSLLETGTIAMADY